MRTPTILSGAIAGVALFSAATIAADLDPIVINGSKFFYKNGTQFFMRGIAYQQNYRGNGTGSTDTTYTDPLADVEACRRDVPLLQQLRTNTIRVYAIDPSKDHSQCMRLLQDAGIYVVSDLSQPDLSINRDTPTWDGKLYTRYTSVIDELAKYSNVIGFFAGNEVSNAPNNTQATPFVKAAVRDMKNYIKRRNYRPMGVGYATNDDASIRENLADFFCCGPREASIDFWGYNIYSWCGQSSYQTSGYADRTKEFEDYPVPVFFAEYGCNTPKPREFEDVQALYGSQMTPVWSGGIIYMYFQEENDFGVVSVSGRTASKLPDFTALSSHMAKASPTGVQRDSYNPTNTQARQCPPTGSGWNASSTLPPTPNQELCGCMMRNLTCVAKTDLDDTTTKDLFDYVCGRDRDACAGIQKDGSSGTYGALSMCSATEQLSWVLNAYYFNQPTANRAEACKFDGNAQTQKPASASGTCRELLGQVGPAGTGSVTASPTAAGTGGTGGGSTSTSTATKSGSASAVTVPRFDFGMLQLGVYIVGAILTGAGMILL